MSPEQMPQMTPEMKELLGQMHTIIAPDPVTSWPVALGWWLLLVVVIGTAVTTIVVLVNHRKRNAYRRSALIIIDQLPPESSSDYATHVSTLLKRVALTAYPKHKHIIVQAYGMQWVEWLNRVTKSPVFEGDASAALADAPYQKGITFNPETLKLSARKWICLHQPRVIQGGQ